MGRDWNGSFEDSKEANREIEDQLLDIMDGNEIGEGDDGGLIKANADGSWEMFGPSDGPKGHYHLGKDADGHYLIYSPGALRRPIFLGIYRKNLKLWYNIKQSRMPLSGGDKNGYEQFRG